MIGMHRFGFLRSKKPIEQDILDEDDEENDFDDDED